MEMLLIGKIAKMAMNTIKWHKEKPMIKEIDEQIITQLEKKIISLSLENMKNCHISSKS